MLTQRKTARIIIIMFSFNISACGFVLVGLKNNNNKTLMIIILSFSRCITHIIRGAVWYFNI